jgi:hypothetical protein
MINLISHYIYYSIFINPFYKNAFTIKVDKIYCNLLFTAIFTWTVIILLRIKQYNINNLLVNNMLINNRGSTKTKHLPYHRTFILHIDKKLLEHCNLKTSLRKSNNI